MVRQGWWTLAELLLEHIDFRPLELNDLLLLLVDPAGENHQQKLPGENETHDSPMLKSRARTSASGGGHTLSTGRNGHPTHVRKFHTD
jgi:hypothetical protein